jgi:hypothetical protein
VVALAGSAAVRLLADRVGLTEHLSAALSRRGFVPVHDRGQVLVDVATVLAAGGVAIADIGTLRHEPAWGPVASPATVWRSLEAITPAGLGRIGKARAKARRLIWSQLPDGLPRPPRHRLRAAAAARESADSHNATCCRSGSGSG